MKRHPRIAASFLSLLLLPAASASSLWNPGTDASFDNPANWFPGGVPADGSDLVFDSASSAALRVNGANHTVANLTFSSNVASTSITLENAATLTLTGIVTDNAYKILNTPADDPYLGSLSASAYNRRQTLRVNSGSTLVLDASANTGVLIIENNGSTVAYRGNSSAGGGQPAVNGSVPDANGTPITRVLNKHINATTLLNTAAGDDALLLFTDNATAASANIINTGIGANATIL
ncbi:MAG: hypothetical protein LBR12_01260, partial [Opitutaceae bacterium]|nr:hypothetical protein [Opitutaceae bacterium]